ncbi:MULTISPECIES: hypothetical protein [Arthrobacter]|uniref:hypothetical protein n=1 Tax=Arthrobacter TaxID=1663 RepID=UPI001D15B662|nr:MULTISPECIES: hypothetical protein [Arthrobacter]MCC3281669.1 hypothetical protein [Arthrobacter caoxuetaonis]MCC9194888.1 hypothetical protein [Arthrobacter sp. zg-Y916]
MAGKKPQGKPGRGGTAGAKAKPRGGSGSRMPARPSKAVYRRRRLVLLLALLLVIAGGVWGATALAGALSRPGNADAAEPFQSAPTASPSAAENDGGKAPEEPDAPAEGEADPACPAAAVKVEAATDAPVYAAGVNPVLSLTVTNTGPEPCEINVGTTQMEFTVTSGSDRIFSSVDCQDGGEDLVKEFAAGASETANFTWERLRSAPGCTAVASNPNPGWYVFTASLGGKTSEKAVFQLD